MFTFEVAGGVLRKYSRWKLSVESHTCYQAAIATVSFTGSLKILIRGSKMTQPIWSLTRLLLKRKSHWSGSWIRILHWEKHFLARSHPKLSYLKVDHKLGQRPTKRIEWHQVVEDTLHIGTETAVTLKAQVYNDVNSSWRWFTPTSLVYGSINLGNYAEVNKRHLAITVHVPVDVSWAMGCTADRAIGEDCKWTGHHSVLHKEGRSTCARGWETGENLNRSGFYDIGVHDSSW